MATDGDKNPGTCEDCGEEVEERCNDGYCRGCHVSLSFESCVDGTWADGLRRQYGLPTQAEREGR